jgi:hypothetical protein
MKWYLRGFTNYDHHEDAKFAFKRVREGVVAMRHGVATSVVG